MDSYKAGDTVTANKIGYVGRSKLVCVSCPQCNKLRWVRAYALSRGWELRSRQGNPEPSPLNEYQGRREGVETRAEGILPDNAR